MTETLRERLGEFKLIVRRVEWHACWGTMADSEGRTWTTEGSRVFVSCPEAEDWLEMNGYPWNPQTRRHDGATPYTKGWVERREAIVPDALSAARKEAARAERERAARVAEGYGESAAAWDGGAESVARAIAAAIRKGEDSE